MRPSECEEKDDDTCARAAAMELLPPPASSCADSRVSATLMRAGVVAVRGVIPRETACAAAAEIDEALQVACERAREYIGREDSRCLASCSVHTLGRRWECRLRASGIATSTAARAYLVAQQAMAESLRGPDDERFCGPVRELNLRGSSVRGHMNRRFDLRLHFTGAVKAAVVAAVKALRPTIAELLTDDALVCELACLTTDPGATRQQLHADTTFEDRGFLVTVFIALQDVHSDMGGTLVIPGSASRAEHESMKRVAEDSTGRYERRVLCERGKRFEGDAGAALLMDSRCLHCGGANSASSESGSRRRLLYVTFQVPHCRPSGGTMSILPEYEGRFRLGNVEHWCAPHEQQRHDYWRR